MKLNLKKNNQYNHSRRQNVTTKIKLLSRQVQSVLVIPKEKVGQLEDEYKDTSGKLVQRDNT